jgi:LysR family glycine cleavage system transcriptional activator
LPETFPEHADIVIHYEEQPGWKDMHCTRLVDIYGFPACSPELLERYPSPEKPEDLRNFHLLHGNDRESWKAWLQEYCDTPVNGRRSTFYNDFTMTIAAAVNGDGVIMADPILCKAELKSGQLVPLFTETVFEVSYTACCPETRYKNSIVGTVYDRLVEEMKNL